MTLEEKLVALYNKAESFDEEIPAQLSKQIETYCEILMLLGKLQASATLEYGKAYAERKKVYGVTLAETVGTQAVKEGQAEKDAYQFRLLEAEMEAELERWKLAFISTQELIQAKKKSLDLLKLELGGK